MLVLSRGRNDKVVFPTLGITVEILRINGGNVRIGIEAPQEIPILREEILARGNIAAPTRSAPTDLSELAHAVRNRLQNATLGLRVLQKMLESGQSDETEPTIFNIFNELKFLEAEFAPVGSSPPTAAAVGRGRRVLVVEDDPNESELLAGYLRLSGLEVTTAMDGLQAMIRLSDHERTDVVLLDMKMPRFDGRKTVSAIRLNREYRSLKIFAVTGSDQRESAVDIGPQGVDRWFRKPIDPEILVDAIHDELSAEVALT